MEKGKKAVAIILGIAVILFAIALAGLTFMTGPAKLSEAKMQEHVALLKEMKFQGGDSDTYDEDEYSEESYSRELESFEIAGAQDILNVKKIAVMHRRKKLKKKKRKRKRQKRKRMKRKKMKRTQ